MRVLFLDGRNGQVDGSNELDGLVEILCEDLGIARHLKASVDRTVDCLVVCRHILGTLCYGFADGELLRGSERGDRAFVSSLLADGGKHLVRNPALEAFGAFEL